MNCGFWIWFAIPLQARLSGQLWIGEEKGLYWTSRGAARREFAARGGVAPASARSRA